jgi:hypothetical protein
MTTITQLVDRIQLLLNDSAASIWAQTDIEEWAIDGIRDYSIHFPRTVTASYATEVISGEQSWTLEGDFLAALLVEFPVGDDPPTYLKRLARSHPDFWLSDDYYDIELAGSDPSRPATIYISATPTAGQELSITYHAYHIPAANAVPPSSAAISVPSIHEHIIEAYAIWQAHVERLNTEIQSPDTTIRLIQQYKLAVQATENSYRAALRAAINARSAGGWTGPWTVDNNDRIY